MQLVLVDDTPYSWPNKQKPVFRIVQFTNE